MENEDYSDSSDEDYVPNGGEIVSEEEDSGEAEDFMPGEEDEGGSEDKKCPTSKSNCRSKLPTKRKRGCRQSKANAKASNCDSKLTATEKAPKDDATEETKELEEKKKDEDLWADFLKDVGGASKGKSTVTTSASSSISTPSPSPRTNASNKVAITKEYNFAGETVVVTKEVDVNSKDAKSASSSNTDIKNISASTKPSPVPSVASVAPALKRPSGGLSAILGKLDKKPKLSTLDKSKLDWDSFKEKEGIDEELKTHNRGKEGYLERVAFLERADQRQFEIERSLRLGTSRKQ